MIYFLRYALKKLNKAENDADAIENEINLLRMLSHPHVVKFYGEFMDSNSIHCILLEYCEVSKYLTI